jgi:hypothetical protein
MKQQRESAGFNLDTIDGICQFQEATPLYSGRLCTSALHKLLLE